MPIVCSPIARPRPGSLLLDGVGVEVVLAHVVAQVAGVDPEQVRRLLAHAVRPAVRLEQQLALELVEGVAQVQLAPRERRALGRRAPARPRRRGRGRRARGRDRGSSPARSRCAARARCRARGRRRGGRASPTGSAGRRPPEPPRDLVGEVAGEERDVVPALAQRRHVDAHDVQAVEEVRAEAALLRPRPRGRCWSRPRRARRRASAARRRAARTRRPGSRAAAWPARAAGIAPTSSSSSVPRSASWKRPSRSAAAPANEPLRWPKNSLSHISSGHRRRS